MSTPSESNQAAADIKAQPGEVAEPNLASDFDGSDLPHASRAIAFVQHLADEDYRLASYLNNSNAAFDAQRVAAFIRTGELPEGKELTGRPRIRWCIDARIPATSPSVPDTPWYYDQSSLRGSWDTPFSSQCVSEMKTEWDQISGAFGPQLHSAGRRLLDISAIALAAPEKYESTRYTDIRASEDVTFAEFLAFADGYWLHLFVTDWKSPTVQSIVTLSFTPHVADRHALPPSDDENLLLLEAFQAAEQAK